MLRRICTLQIQPRKDVQDHAAYTASPRQHVLDHTWSMYGSEIYLPWKAGIGDVSDVWSSFSSKQAWELVFITLKGSKQNKKRKQKTSSLRFLSLLIEQVHDNCTTNSTKQRHYHKSRAIHYNTPTRSAVHVTKCPKESTYVLVRILILLILVVSVRRATTHPSQNRLKKNQNQDQINRHPPPS